MLLHDTLVHSTNTLRQLLHTFPKELGHIRLQEIDRRLFVSKVSLDQVSIAVSQLNFVSVDCRSSRVLTVAFDERNRCLRRSQLLTRPVKWENNNPLDFP